MEVTRGVRSVTLININDEKDTEWPAGWAIPGYRAFANDAMMPPLHMATMI